MIPPKGFVLSSQFSGFVDEVNGSSILVTEVPGGYEEMATGFTQEALTPKGIRLEKKSTIAFNGKPATWLVLNQSSQGITFEKQVLLFQHSAGTVLVTANYPKTASHLKLVIEKAMLTTAYNTAQDDDPTKAAPFSIDVTGTTFKATKFVAGGLIFTVEGKLPTKQPTFLVANSLTGRAPAPAQRELLVAQLFLRFTRDSVAAESDAVPIVVNKLDGLAVESEFDNGKEGIQIGYMAVIFHPKGHYYILYGEANENFDAYLSDFRKLTTTFKLKSE